MLYAAKNIRTGQLEYSSENYPRTWGNIKLAQRFVNSKNHTWRIEDWKVVEIDLDRMTIRILQ